MSQLPPSRHLLRAKDLADARYAQPVSVPDMAAVARLSPAHFSGSSQGVRRSSAPVSADAPARARGTLLRNSDWTVLRICVAVGLSSVGSFTTSFAGCRVSPRLAIARPASRPPARLGCRAAWSGRAEQPDFTIVLWPFRGRR
ncbi:MAG: hypothetical protein ACRCYU_05775 [Nocardioides sp.]